MAFHLEKVLSLTPYVSLSHNPVEIMPNIANISYYLSILSKS